MQSTRRFFLATVVASLALSGCTDTVAPGPITTTGLSARINGQQWSSDSSVAGVNKTQPGEFQFAARPAGATYTLSFTLQGIGGVGTYALGTDGTIGGGMVTVREQSGDKIWDTPGTGAAGTLTITEINSQRITGTFSFVATPVSNSATGNITVTDGKFDLPMRIPGSLEPLPANVISKIHTKILGEDFTPSSLQAFLPGTSTANFAIVGGNPKHYFVLFLADVTGPGTYQLDPNKTRWMHIGYSSSGHGPLEQTWVGYDRGNTGSVTITSITANRVVGRFNATIQPAVGTTVPLTISGDFDVGRTMKSYPQ